MIASDLIARAASRATPWKSSVRIASDTQITPRGVSSIQSVTLQEGDRVLLNGQTAARQNGVYVVSAGDWSRATDFDETSAVQLLSIVQIEAGAKAGRALQIKTLPAGFTLGRDAFSFQDVGLVGQASPDTSVLTVGSLLTAGATYRYNGSAGDTFTLPRADSVPGQAIGMIEVEGSATSNTFQPEVGTINGVASLAVATANATFVFVAFGDTNDWRSMPFAP